jgi:cobalt-zinc-cadmium efflux system outer membrane protein
MEGRLNARAPGSPGLGFAEPSQPPVEADAAPTSLKELVAIASRHHPDLKAARARVEIARGRMIQAGLYPNPVMGPNFSELNHSDGALGEVGVRWIQTIVTANKLGLATSAAAHGVEAADHQVLAKAFEVITRVRLGYYELLTALREQQTVEEIVAVADKALKAAEKLEAAGAGSRPDVLRAEVELRQSELRREVARVRVNAARENLGVALGRPPLSFERLRLDVKELDAAPPSYDWTALIQCVHESSAELLEARSLIAQAERLVAKAKADARPNIDVSALPFYASQSREVRGNLAITAPIPIFDRNQGNIHAAEHELGQRLELERVIELRLIERLVGAYQRYQAAGQQVRDYAAVIIPKAEKSRALIEAGYLAGDKKYDYTALLQAQQVLAQAKLAQTQAQGDLWRSVVEIAGILQQDDLRAGCAVRRRP